MEKQGKLFGDCGLCHQPDADGTLKEKDTGGIWKRRKGTDFYDRRHRNDFSSLLLGRRKKNLCGFPNYAAAVFLLSADENLWEKVSKQVLDTGIYFDRIRLGSVTLEQYILFHAARDVYLGTKHIRLSELTDRELIPDEILRLIVNAFVMERYGVDIVEREVWNED